MRYPLPPLEQLRLLDGEGGQVWLLRLRPALMEGGKPARRPQEGSVADIDIGGFNVLRILGIKNHRIQI